MKLGQPDDINIFKRWCAHYTIKNRYYWFKTKIEEKEKYINLFKEKRMCFVL